jgi:hypothetical protein
MGGKRDIPTNPTAAFPDDMWELRRYIVADWVFLVRCSNRADAWPCTEGDKHNCTVALSHLFCYIIFSVREEGRECTS